MSIGNSIVITPRKPFTHITAWLRRSRASNSTPLIRPGRVPYVWNLSRAGNVLDSGFGAGLIISRGTHLPGAHKAVISPANCGMNMRALREYRDPAGGHIRVLRRPL